MTVTAERLTPADELWIAETRKHSDRLDALKGGVEPTPEQRLVDAILAVAVSHDTVCQYLGDYAYKHYGLRNGTPAAADPDDAPLNDYLYGAIQLCAILAPAAARRVPARIFAESAADDGVIESLKADKLEAFMRPIFEESGIGHRFEPRASHEAYPWALTPD